MNVTPTTPTAILPVIQVLSRLIWSMRREQTFRVRSDSQNAPVLFARLRPITQRSFGEKSELYTYVRLETHTYVHTYIHTNVHQSRYSIDGLYMHTLIN